MDKWSSESTGMDVLRPVADQKLKIEPFRKKRIWSEELEAWGFFVPEDEVSQQDKFLLLCSILPGDRFYLKIDPEKDLQMSIIVEIYKKSPFWIFKLLNQDGQICEISTKENELFRQAQKFAF